MNRKMNMDKMLMMRYANNLDSTEYKLIQWLKR
jgi:hypothetical protein